MFLVACYIYACDVLSISISESSRIMWNHWLREMACDGCAACTYVRYLITSLSCVLVYLLAITILYTLNVCMYTTVVCMHTSHIIQEESK